MLYLRELRENVDEDGRRLRTILVVRVRKAGKSLDIRLERTHTGGHGTGGQSSDGCGNTGVSINASMRRANALISRRREQSHQFFAQRLPARKLLAQPAQITNDRRGNFLIDDNPR